MNKSLFLFPDKYIKAVMNGERNITENGHENQKKPVTKTMITDALKGLSEVKTAKMNIEKVFVLNEKCFVKGIKPASGNVIQLHNANSLPNSKTIQQKKDDSNKTNENQLIEIKNDNKPTLQISGNNTKKIIISGTKAVNDVETLKKLISQLAHANNISNNQIIINDAAKKIIIQNTHTVVHEEKTIVQNQLNKSSVKFVESDKARDTKLEKNIEKNRTIEVKSTNCETNRIPEAQKESPQTTPESEKPAKQKRFLYRLKSKNGKILTYTSDVPIRLKRPHISVTKMTQADAERLSKQFAEETRKRSKEGNRRENDKKRPVVVEEIKKNPITVDEIKKKPATVDETKKKPVALEEKKKKNAVSIEKPGVSLRSGNSTNVKLDAESSVTPATPTCGVQTRKRQIKFLSDGRVVKDKKSRRESTSSSTSLSSSSASDNEKESSSSDEDYTELSEFIKFKKNRKPVKKTSPQNKSDTSQVKTAPAAKSNKSTKADSTSVIKTTQIANFSQQGTSEHAKKLPIDPALLLSSLLGVKILPSQLNTSQFKPKALKERSNNLSVVTRKAVLQTSSEPLILKTPNVLPKNPAVVRTNSDPLIAKGTPTNRIPKSAPVGAPWHKSSEPPPLTPISKPGPSSKHNIVNPPVRTKPPMEPVPEPAKTLPTPPVSFKPFKTIVQSAPLLASKTEPPPEVLAKFKTFSDTKVVKTKEGPKKLLLDKLDEIENPKTIYDVMSDVFDTMPSWNIHLLPDNKSFCLAQVSRSRMGVPVLKKCVELDPEFKAKVYVHQLHCKRYDGVYDTESKLMKLINDIDALVV